jgi:galactose mutarotase-like enzyme
MTMTTATLHTLSSHGYQAVISSLGAELKSFGKEGGENLIWPGDPAIWKGTAPILFPIVGRLKNGQYQYKNNTYQLDKHGFARTSIFELNIDTNSEKSFVLTSSSDTLKHYPFHFEFEVFFSIASGVLEVRYEVRNVGNEDLWFTLGSHPAFSLPLTDTRLEDFYLQFEQSEQLDCYFLENDLLCTSPITSFLNDTDTLAISTELFKNDALIFKDIKSRTVSIHHKHTGKRLTLSYDNAPHLGIWAKAGSPFICLEPWFSYDDSADTTGELTNKQGIMSLAAHQSFNTRYTVII